MKGHYWYCFYVNSDSVSKENMIPNIKREHIQELLVEQTESQEFKDWKHTNCYFNSHYFPIYFHFYNQCLF